MKKKISRLWNNFLILSIPLSIISLVICACCLDSESIIPIIVGTINLLWIALIVEANLPEKEGEKNGKNRPDRAEIWETNCNK